MSLYDPIFYITNDSERAIGLEEIVDLHILAIDDSWLARQIHNKTHKVFILEREIGILNPIFRNSNKLLQEPLTQEYIDHHSQDIRQGMVFKIAPNIERTAQALGIQLLNTTSQQNQRFENKIPQLEFLKELDNIPLPKSEIYLLGDTDHQKLISEFSDPYVIQFDRGHTGTGTLFIRSEDELEDLKSAFPKRPVRISQYIEGEAWTLNAVSTRWGTHYGGLSYQITGVEPLTRVSGATVGNDWSRAHSLPDNTISQIAMITKKVGDGLFEEGFRGLFGLDLIVDDKGKAFLIEINARQPASTGMHTKLMLKNQQIPLQLLHIAEFLGLTDSELIQYMTDRSRPAHSLTKLQDQLSEQDRSLGRDINASQCILRNSASGNITIAGDLGSGIYDRTDRDLSEQAIDDRYSIDHLDEDEFLLITATEGRIVTPGTEYARIQTYGSVLDNSGKLLPVLVDIINKLKGSTHEEATTT
ncbi:ATP-grasp domain-containing protein [Candidatus Nomurabacteria bacterium]|uniref:ATP-grasp domain-containing protein n=1 Tax=Candidatus Dojkabacteria bacterium TaxID=2099670 RepID=A0A955I2C3_9BACT|nr:ATP-grasp domain-containing protein [Candidatus Dojkabacteria bacterium]MCB9789939.1 ATP-grasp domain-containing protein [Candidatus Nomurabacteria bacterium]MCB9803435.1 ATP-grasp domain-containing protein [Candidatus Nomurabacteria bacterium]